MRSWKLLLTWTARAHARRRHEFHAPTKRNLELWSGGNLIVVGQTSISGRRVFEKERWISRYPILCIRPFPRKFRDSSTMGRLSSSWPRKFGIFVEIRVLFFTSVAIIECATRLFVEVSILESIHFDSFAYSFFRDQFEIEKRRNDVRVK